MTLRTFVAPDGDEWRAWQVIPTLRLTSQLMAERRGQDVLEYNGPERRGKDGGDRPSAADYVQPHLASGWLCFESDREKRRLAPPPAGWDSCSDEELTEIWSRAALAPKIAPRPWTQIAGAAPAGAAEPAPLAEAAPVADEAAPPSADPLAAG